MNEAPTSGPMPSSRTHQALETTSSRHSLSSSQSHVRKESWLAAGPEARLGKRKKYLFQVFVGSRPVSRFRQRRQFRNRPLAAYAPAAQQHEPVAEARRVADLMNREEECPSAGRVRAQCH